MKILLALLLTAVTTVCSNIVDTSSPTIPPRQDTSVQLSAAFGGLEFDRPVALVFSGESALVVEQPGRIMLVTGEAESWTNGEFLDITDRVNDGGNEEGLLGLALDPDFNSNGQFYVYYTAGTPRRSVVSQFTIEGDGANSADPGSESVVLELSQPYSNHNGGQLVFGPDGFLYIGLGDGGSRADPNGNGQNVGSLLGSILRIDVSSHGAASRYTVPSDNPLVGVNGARPEIWAYGLRNPWRFTFDLGSGELWAADVGQNSREEVDLIEPGRNYGWNVMEGSECFSQRGESCDSVGLEPPVAEYGRDEGCSITGGYVYRGSRIPSLTGHYVYGDFCSGKIWAFDRRSSDGNGPVELIDTRHRISSFGEDKHGEIYVLSLDGGVYTLTQ